VLKALDIQQVHQYKNESASTFFDNLANTDNLPIFDLRSIQCLIELKYPFVMAATVKKLFIPYVIYLLVFVIYMNLFSDYKNVYDQMASNELKA